MESSFGAKYQTTKGDDGSIALSFEQIRYYPQSLANVFVLVGMFLIVPASCTGSMLLQSKNNNDLPIVPMVLIASFLVGIFWLLFIKSVPSTIKIYPDVGVEFDGKSLPFNDIESLGIVTKSNSSKTWGYVVANSGGQEIALTKWMDEALARSLQSQIVATSGRAFG
jgi:hypothetical protein